MRIWRIALKFGPKIPKISNKKNCEEFPLFKIDLPQWSSS